MNPCSKPFAALHHVDLTINFNDQTDDYRRIVAENWCCHRTQSRWFRRVFTDRGFVRFEFDDKAEAALFKLSNP